MNDIEIISLLQEQVSLLRQILKHLRRYESGSEGKNLSVTQAGKCLNRSPATIRRWIHEGKIKATKLNRGKRQDHYIINKDEIDRIIQEAIEAKIGAKRW